MKVIVAVDYGTTCTGVSIVDPEQGRKRSELEYVRAWSEGIDSKVPSRIAYVKQGSAHWGFEVLPGMSACSWTKLLLDSGTNPTEFDDTFLDEAAALGIFQVPPEKTPVDVVADYLCFIYQALRKELTRRFYAKSNNVFVDFWFTIPAMWSENAKAQTIEAANRAGFGQAPGDRLEFMTEPEAAAEAVFNKTNAAVKNGDGILICDCGGGTVDIATYLVTDDTTDRCMQKLTSVQGGKCGGAAIDSRFYQLMKTRFGSSFEDLPPRFKAPGSVLMDEFENVKKSFSRATRKSFPLRLDMKLMSFDTRYYDAGHIILSGDDMQRLFDPVIAKIIKLIGTQLEVTEKECGYPVIKHIFMVGGLSASQYVQRALQCYHNPGKLSVTTPSLPQLAVATGAAIRGVYGGHRVTRKCPSNYGFETSRPPQPVADCQNHINPWEGFENIPSDNRTAYWVLRKNQTYPQGHSCQQTLSRFYQPGDSLVTPIPIYACGLLEPPGDTSHESVTLISHIVVDFTRLNLNRFTHREIDNQMVYYFQYVVDTVFDANCDMLRFKVQAFEETIGAKNLQMWDNY